MNTICPMCLQDARILVDIGDGDTLTCTQCDEEYSVSKIEEMVASWGKLLPWLKAHPARTPQCASV